MKLCLSAVVFCRVRPSCLYDLFIYLFIYFCEIFTRNSTIFEEMTRTVVRCRATTQQLLKSCVLLGIVHLQNKINGKQHTANDRRT